MQNDINITLDIERIKNFYFSFEKFSSDYTSKANTKEKRFSTHDIQFYLKFFSKSYPAINNYRMKNIMVSKSLYFPESTIKSFSLSLKCFRE